MSEISTVQRFSNYYGFEFLISEVLKDIFIFCKKVGYNSEIKYPQSKMNTPFLSLNKYPDGATTTQIFS